MKKAKFFIDELNFATLICNIKNNYEELNNIISAAENADSTTIDTIGLKYEKFYLIEKNGTTIGEELSLNKNNEFRDLTLRLNILASRWDSSSDEADVNDIHGFGISSLKTDGHGALIASSVPTPSLWWNDAKMHLISSAKENSHALRKHFIDAKIEQKYFPNFCNAMFPHLYFHAPPDKLKDLNISYIENIQSIINYFSYLNDFALDHFDSDEPHVIIANARANGITISPESFNTRRNAGAMKEREIEINNEKLSCEWHAKITASRGRIHFYARRTRPERIKAKTGSKVIIGILASHLTI